MSKDGFLGCATDVKEAALAATGAIGRLGGAVARGVASREVAEAVERAAIGKEAAIEGAQVAAGVQNEGWGRTIAKTAGGVVGGVAGAGVGGAVGTGKAPGPGTAAGVFIGTAGGALFGSCAAGEAYDWAFGASPEDDFDRILEGLGPGDYHRAKAARKNGYTADQITDAIFNEDRPPGELSFMASGRDLRDNPYGPTAGAPQRGGAHGAGEYHSPRGASPVVPKSEFGSFDRRKSDLSV